MKEESDFSTITPNYALQQISFLFVNQKEIWVFGHKIREKIDYLGNQSFQTMSFQRKKDWFIETIDDLKQFQKSHYNSLQKFVTHVIKSKLNCLNVLQVTKEFIHNTGAMEYTYEEDDNGMSCFQSEINRFKPYLSDRLEIFNLVKEHYVQLNEENQTLLNDFFNTFFLSLKAQEAKEKIDELYLSQFIPESYDIVDDQKDLILTNEIILKKPLETQIIKERILFKKTMKEFSESIFNELKIFMLENTTGNGQYLNFKSYLARK